MMIDQEINRVLKTYGSALERNEKRSLVEILDLSKRHSDACSEAVRLVPMHAILMTVLLEREKILLKLMQEVNELSSGESSEK